MIITWDEPKRRANLLKHGLDFGLIDIDFFAGAMVMRAKHDRFKAIGTVEGRSVALIFARLGSEGVSIISMRPASVRERRLA